MFLSTLSVTTAHVPIIKSFLLLPQANALSDYLKHPTISYWPQSGFNTGFSAGGFLFPPLKFVISLTLYLVFINSSHFVCEYVCV